MIIIILRLGIFFFCFSQMCLVLIRLFSSFPIQDSREEDDDHDDDAPLFFFSFSSFFILLLFSSAHGLHLVFIQKLFLIHFIQSGFCFRLSAAGDPPFVIIRSSIVYLLMLLMLITMVVIVDVCLPEDWIDNHHGH